MYKKINPITLILAVFVFVFFTGCQQEKIDIPQETLKQVSIDADENFKAVAVLHPTFGSKTHGTVTFTKVGTGVQIVADLSELRPGTHGFHIHEFGDCSANDAVSAGGHFNPEEMPHSGPNSQERHAGDLGNIEADENGTAHKVWIDSHLSINGPQSIIGRSVVVHQNTDDLKSQPSGNAGPRIACGVIGLAKPTLEMESE